MTLTKDQLRAGRAGKGGTLVRMTPARQARADAAWRTYSAGDPSAPDRRYIGQSLDGIYVVKDLFNRKTYDQPRRVGIGPVDRGIAFSVDLDEIMLVVTVGTRVRSWQGATGEVVEIITDSKLKPYRVALDDGSTAFYHPNQITVA